MKKKADTTIAEGSKSEHAATAHFLSRDWVEMVVVIEKGETDALLSIIHRTAGQQHAGRFPVSDDLEHIAQQLAYRFGSYRPEIVYT
jgi:hypothetical protein